MSMPKSVYALIFKDLQIALNNNKITFKDWFERFKIISEDYSNAYPNECITDLIFENGIKQEKKYFSKESTTQDILKLFIDKAQNGTSQEQQNILEEYIQLIYENNRISKTEAKKAALKNLGYLMGYCDDKTQKLIKKTYNLKHPIFEKDVICY